MIVWIAWLGQVMLGNRIGYARLGYAMLRWASLGLRDLEAVKYLLFYITAVSLSLQKLYIIDVGAKACLVRS
jgi:hypothetical protein